MILKKINYYKLSTLTYSLLLFTHTIAHAMAFQPKSV